ncbi:MAG: hypothetical protein AVDCRST_MAG19-3285, partial [uncultured Thermomicrobiales bacterium]
AGREVVERGGVDLRPRSRSASRAIRVARPAERGVHRFSITTSSI